MSTQLFCSSTKLKFDRDVESPFGMQRDQDIDLFIQEIESRSEGHARSTLDSFHNGNNGSEHVKSLSYSDKPNTQNLALGTPRVSSPTSSISTPSSPNMSPFIWDSPQTPQDRSDRLELQLTTPLTPPMAWNLTQVSHTESPTRELERPKVEHHTRIRSFQSMLSEISK